MPDEQTGAPSCANCGRTMGRLEVPRHWDGHVVCAPCEAILRSSADAAACAPPPYASPFAAGPTVPPPAYPPPAYPPPAYPHAGQRPPAYETGLYAPSRYPLSAPTPAPLSGPVDLATGHLSCGACGGSFIVNELTEENGRVVCRACALGAAAAGATVRRRRGRDGSPALFVGAGAALVVVAVGGVLLLRPTASEPT
ncbi:MAG TPA: hypothetical protein VF796_27820, partial [Humisphaera sp.]